MNPHRKWKNYFIKKDFQGKYVMISFLVVIASSILFSGILAFFSSDTITLVYENHDLQLGATSSVLLKKVIGAFLIFMIFGGIIVVIGSILITHRVAGPMLRIESTFDAMKKGDLSVSANLRKGDEGQEMAEKMNQFNAMLSAKLNDTLQLVSMMEEQLGLLPDEIRSSDSPSAAALDQIQEINMKIKDQIGTFILKK